MHYIKIYFKKLFFGILFFSLILSFYNFASGLEEGESITFKVVPKVSIVMPVYNVASYLDEALDSAENQTLKDLEIICVNDGSTDNSLEILKTHAKKDSRIKIISQENQGLSEARNVGMRASVGKYIYFFDSDDVMAPYAMEKAVNNLEKYNADVLEFNIEKFEYTEHVDLSKYSYKNAKVNVYDSKKGKNPFEVFKITYIAAWKYVYRKSFLNDNKLEFKKGLRIHEDVLFNWLFTPCIKRLVKDNNICYFYRIHRPDSIMNADFRLNRKRLDGFLIIISELMLNKDKFRFFNGEEYLLKKVLDLVYNCVARTKDKDEKKFYASRIYEELWKNFGEKCGVKLSYMNKLRLDSLKDWSQS